MAFKRQSGRAFGITFAVFFCLIAAVAWLVFEVFLKWALVVAAIFAAAAIVSPGLLLPLNRVWASVAQRIGLMNNYLLLGLFFYLFILPIGLLVRIFGGDPMTRKPVPELESYWTPVKRRADPDTYRDMF